MRGGKLLPFSLLPYTFQQEQFCFGGGEYERTSDVNNNSNLSYIITNGIYGNGRFIMTIAFRNGKAFICQNPACKKKFYKYGYASNSAYRHLWGNGLEELQRQIDHYEANGWRQSGEITESTFNGSAWVHVEKINHQDYGPFFHSQGCMHEWIGDNITDIHNILLAQNNNSVNIPE